MRLRLAAVGPHAASDGTRSSPRTATSARRRTKAALRRLRVRPRAPVAARVVVRGYGVAPRGRQGRRATAERACTPWLKPRLRLPDSEDALPLRALHP